MCQVESDGEGMWGDGNCSLGPEMDSSCRGSWAAPDRTLCLSRQLSKECFLPELVPVPLSHYPQEE